MLGAKGVVDAILWGSFRAGSPKHCTHSKGQQPGCRRGSRQPPGITCSHLGCPLPLPTSPGRTPGPSSCSSALAPSARPAPSCPPKPARGGLPDQLWPCPAACPSSALCCCSTLEHGAAARGAGGPVCVAPHGDVTQPIVYVTECLLNTVLGLAHHYVKSSKICHRFQPGNNVMSIFFPPSFFKV